MVREPFSWVSRAELSTYTQNQLLRDTDVMSMAHSLEVRVPLLDHCLVEAVLRLPADAHGRSVSPKPLLTAALNGLLPAQVTDRRDKQGFVFPFDRWMRGPLRSRLTTWFDVDGADPWVRPESARAVWKQYETGQAHWSRPWALAVLQSGLVVGR